MENHSFHHIGYQLLDSIWMAHVVRMSSTGNSESLLMGMQNGTATLENSLATSYKRPSYHMTQQSYSLAFAQINWKTMSMLKRVHRMLIAALINLIDKTWKQDVLQ